ncbi:ferritin-like fold-containing protein [Dactylosporangium sp. CA-233914]|uniref:ferritin-like fold-containing protein n=1 Tax=Dactylosporangium sp. CA-233914 TaxID=3239934 RepID=UPI003D9091FD
MSDLTPAAAPNDGTPVDEPPMEAVVDLLGMLAYGELVAFDRMAADARLAPDLRRRAVLSEMAAREITNYRRLAGRLAELGADPEAAMAPYVRAVSDYHEQTEPNDWLEGLTKAYVGDAIADDFTREVALVLASPDRDLILDVLHDSEHADFAADELRAAIAIDPKVANRLSMWARRLVGEAISQSLRVAGERPSLAALLAGRGTDFQALLKRLTTAHTARMGAVGLNN